MYFRLAVCQRLIHRPSSGVATESRLPVRCFQAELILAAEHNAGSPQVTSIAGEKNHRTVRVLYDLQRIDRESRRRIGSTGQR